MSNRFPASQFIHTPITKAALIDGLIIRDNELQGIYESKCRRESVDSFRDKFSNDWLISYHKLKDGCHLAKSLAVPFWGFLYLVNDRKVIAIKIADDKGGIVQDIRIERRKTSKCCNGGTMMDTCAFINIRHGFFIN